MMKAKLKTVKGINIGNIYIIIIDQDVVLVIVLIVMMMLMVMRMKNDYFQYQLMYAI